MNQSPDEPIDDAAEAPDEPVPTTDAPPEGTEESASPAGGEVPPGMASLTVKRGGVETEEVFLFSAPAVIGRFDPSVGPIDIDLGAIPEGAYVSRKHARFTCEDGVWRVEDTGSSNGTYVLRGDFERVESTELADGDELALGNARFVFRAGAPV